MIEAGTLAYLLRPNHKIDRLRSFSNASAQN